MLNAVEGTYKDGKVKLSELPSGVKSSRVVVTFLPEEAKSSTDRHIMTFGMLGGDGSYNEDDFQAAKATKRLDNIK